MQELPHHYIVSANAKTVGNVALSANGVSDLESAPPAEFGGPGDQWSPESLLVAAVADCFILSFRAIARASNLEWDSLNCEVEGILDQVDRVTQFIVFNVKASVGIPSGSDESKALRLLGKAEHACLITNSLKADSYLEASAHVSKVG
ncbi:MAG: OsmC family peroxiredoxin [Gammaproteobacteria bacterium]|jgi:organic hydroperoxide reductase OsmC/OhrA|nr:OsmC family peroxiredoxin [Gammaproteobacteria bacterium]